jgi:hypothetical protein
MLEGPPHEALRLELNRSYRVPVCFSGGQRPSRLDAADAPETGRKQYVFVRVFRVYRSRVCRRSSLLEFEKVTLILLITTGVSFDRAVVCTRWCIHQTMVSVDAS